MTSLPSLLKQIGAALAAACPNEVYHYFRPAGVYPYIVWKEDTEDESLYTDNHKTEQAIHGTVDLYTKTEYDERADRIQSVLDGMMQSWRIQSVQYEESQKLIHYQWEWVISVHGED